MAPQTAERGVTHRQTSTTATCAGTTKSGQPCQYKAKTPSQFCGHHSKQQFTPTNARVVTPSGSRSTASTGNSKVALPIACAATTKSGQRCRYKPQSHSQYCGHHAEKSSSAILVQEPGLADKLQRLKDNIASRPPSKELLTLVDLPRLDIRELPRYVFRSVRPDEDVSVGIIAKEPKRGMTVAGHVTSGDRNKGSQFISLTDDPAIALFYACRAYDRQLGDCKIIRIDLSKCHGRAFDLRSTESQKQHNVTGATAQNFSRNSREVLLEGYIPPEAIVTVLAFESLPEELYQQKTRIQDFNSWKRKVQVPLQGFLMSIGWSA